MTVRMDPRWPLLGLLLLGGCGEGAEPSSEAQGPGAALEALGYVGFVENADANRPAGVVVYDAAAVSPGWTLVMVHRIAEALLLDESGAILHRWRSPEGRIWGHCELTPEGRLIVPEVGKDNRYTLRCLDWDSNTVWNVDIRAHHDVELRPDGKISVLSFVDERTEAGIGVLPFRDEFIAVVNPETGAVEEEHSFYDMHAAAPGAFPLIGQRWYDGLPGGRRRIDLWHANSVEWMHRPELESEASFYGPGHVLCSFRHQQRVAIFDIESGRAVWSWGMGEIHGSHDASLLASGNVLIFDNGLGRGWSRAVEVDPRSDKIVWEWRADPAEGFFTESRGSAQRLANGNTLMAESDRGHAAEVTSDGRVVWEYFHPGEDDRIATITRVKRVEPNLVDALRAGPGANLPPLKD